MLSPFHCLLLLLLYKQTSSCVCFISYQPGATLANTCRNARMTSASELVLCLWLTLTLLAAMRGVASFCYAEPSVASFRQIVHPSHRGQPILELGLVSDTDTHWGVLSTVVTYPNRLRRSGKVLLGHQNEVGCRSMRNRSKLFVLLELGIVEL